MDDLLLCEGLHLEQSRGMGGDVDVHAYVAIFLVYLLWGDYDVDPPVVLGGVHHQAQGEQRPCGALEGRHAPCFDPCRGVLGYNVVCTWWSACGTVGRGRMPQALPIPCSCCQPVACRLSLGQTKTRPAWLSTSDCCCFLVYCSCVAHHTTLVYTAPCIPCRHKQQCCVTKTTLIKSDRNTNRASHRTTTAPKCSTASIQYEAFAI